MDALARQTLAPFEIGIRAGQTWPRLGHFPRELLSNAYKVHDKPGLPGWKHRLKFIARGLASPRLSQDWFDLWQTPGLAPLVQSHPRLLLKLQRPYLMRGLNTRQRWQVLRQHYSFAFKYFTASAFQEIFTVPGAVVAGLPVVNSGLFSLRLLYHNLYEKEGELSLVLYDETKQARVFTLTFCVCWRHAGRPEIFIGGLQGFKAGYQHESVVAITREMHGLRPKALLLFTLQQISSLWDVTAIRAVSNQTRNLPHDDREIRADYDEFWLESGGCLGTDGNFTLPLAFNPRALSTIRPNKRSLYRQRYEMLADVGSTIRQNMDRLSGACSHSVPACEQCRIAV